MVDQVIAIQVVVAQMVHRWWLRSAQGGAQAVPKVVNAGSLGVKSWL